MTSERASDPPWEFRPSRRGLALGSLGALLARPARAERHGAVEEIRASFNQAFFRRHNRTFRTGAAIHFSHGYQHDMLELTPLAEAARYDADTDAKHLGMLRSPPFTEPDQEYYAPYTSQAYWRVLRVIDWTHKLHGMTYDVMSDAGIPWSEKGAQLDRVLRYYITEEEPGIPRSVAPLDVTMRRAAVMMKPYFTFFRTHYPMNSRYFWYAHWWHPAVYEAMMIGGNGPAQDAWVDAVEEIGRTRVVNDRPGRMLLSREMMPRYARLSPGTANAFDNLHMLHGITYDLLAYEGWDRHQKRAELYRVLDAMAYQPGDEALARKFDVPDPLPDPRRYTPAVEGSEGAMSRIMTEMHEEMAPMMGMADADARARARAMAAMEAKMRAGLEPGEDPGSVHDAMHAAMPGMRMMPGATAPGTVPPMMVETMLRGWQRRHGAMPDAPPMDMGRDPGGVV